VALPVPAAAQVPAPCDPSSQPAIFFQGLPTRLAPLRQEDFGFRENFATDRFVDGPIELTMLDRPGGNAFFTRRVSRDARGGHIFWIALDPGDRQAAVSATFIEADEQGIHCVRTIEQTIREGPAMPFVIRANARGARALGGHRVRSHPLFSNAIQAFGDPARVRSQFGGVACRVSWPLIGVAIQFMNLGGYHACSPRYGRTQTVAIRGERGRAWRTSRGLRIGHSVRQIRRRYPSASRHGRRTWWLVTGRTLIGPSCNGGPCPYPVLSAVARSGRVHVFKLRVGAAGD
jgi:hypothetical protein